MKTVIILMTLLLCVGAAYAFDVSDNASYDTGVLPVNGSFNLTINLLDGETVFFNEGEGSLHIDVDIPDNVTLNGTNDTTVIIDYLIEDFTITENTTINKSILITNTLNNNTVEYGLIFSLTGDFSIVVEEENYQFYLQDGDVIFNITTNLLPMEDEFFDDLTGVKGEQVNVSCGKYLSCPKKATFGNDNKTLVKIGVYVPLDAPEGNSVSQVVFKYTNITRTQNVTFIIRKPDVSVRNYAWNIEECFVENDTIDFDCWLEKWREFDEYEAQRLDQVYARAQALAKKTCNCTNNTITEYVVYGEVDKEIGEAYQQCVNDRDEARDDYGTCTNSLDTAQDKAQDFMSKYGVCKETLLENETGLCAGFFSELKSKDEEWTKKNRRTIWWVVGLIFGSIMIMVFVLWVRHNRRGKINVYR